MPAEEAASEPEKIATKSAAEAPKSEIPTKPVNPLDVPLPAEDEFSDGNAQMESPGEQQHFQIVCLNEKGLSDYVRELSVSERGLKLHFRRKLASFRQ
jgi:hypothetical protein